MTKFMIQSVRNEKQNNKNLYIAIYHGRILLKIKKRRKKAKSDILKFFNLPYCINIKTMHCITFIKIFALQMVPHFTKSVTYINFV